MTTQQQIQHQVLAIAQSKEFITFLDIQHLGSKQQLDRARAALKNANKLKNAGNIFIDGGSYKRMEATEKRVIKTRLMFQGDKWPCGTPRSKNNAFNWQKSA